MMSLCVSACLCRIASVSPISAVSLCVDFDQSGTGEAVWEVTYAVRRFGDQSPVTKNAVRSDNT